MRSADPAALAHSGGSRGHCSLVRRRHRRSSRRRPAAGCLARPADLEGQVPARCDSRRSRPGTSARPGRSWSAVRRRRFRCSAWCTCSWNRPSVPAPAPLQGARTPGRGLARRVAQDPPGRAVRLRAALPGRADARGRGRRARLSPARDGGAPANPPSRRRARPACASSAPAPTRAAGTAPPLPSPRRPPPAPPHERPPAATVPTRPSAPRHRRRVEATPALHRRHGPVPRDTSPGGPPAARPRRNASGRGATGARPRCAGGSLPSARESMSGGGVAGST